MVVVRVQFPINVPDIEVLKQKMLDTTPKYEGLDGLTRKYYVMNEDHSQAGGIYLWESREKAEAWYNPDWFKAMAEAWGQAPEVEYLECPIVVDNESNQVKSQIAA